MNTRIFDELNKNYWHAKKMSGGYYAARTVREHGEQFTLLLHVEVCRRLKIKVPVGKTIDHRDGDGLNNVRTNLRVADRQQQNRNTSGRKQSTSGYIGVSWVRKSRSWLAHIRINKRTRHLGLYATKQQAAAARDYAAKLIDPKFFTLNNPPAAATPETRKLVRKFLYKHQLLRAA